jgi:hypothetical protein
LQQKTAANAIKAEKDKTQIVDLLEVWKENNNQALSELFKTIITKNIQDGALINSEENIKKLTRIINKLLTAENKKDYTEDMARECLNKLSKKVNLKDTQAQATEETISQWIKKLVIEAINWIKDKINQLVNLVGKKPTNWVDKTTRERKTSSYNQTIERA